MDQQNSRYESSKEPIEQSAFLAGSAAVITSAPSMRESSSVLTVSSEKKFEVLLWLLRENRTDIRFWQERLFYASFWLNAAIVGIVAFVLREKITFVARLIFGIGSVCLTVFHLIIAHVAKKSITLNGTDLLRLQEGLLLTESGQYLLDKSIYPMTNTWLTQRYIAFLIALNVILCIGSILIIWLSA